MGKVNLSPRTTNFHHKTYCGFSDVSRKEVKLKPYLRIPGVTSSGVLTVGECVLSKRVAKENREGELVAATDTAVIP